MRIGIDFDNTIAGYDGLFARLAVQTGLLRVAPCGGKRAVRDALRQNPGGELAWQRLQALAYGAYMGDAELIPGVGEFLAECRATGVAVAIVSHKTRYAAADPDMVDLPRAARDWLRLKGFFAPDGFALPADQVFFEPTRQAKIERIAALGCSHFIDDLEEVFAEPGFPPSVEAILFDRACTAPGPSGRCTVLPDWTRIRHHIFGASRAAAPVTHHGGIDAAAPRQPMAAAASR